MTKHDKTHRRLPHEPATTSRPDSPDLETGTPLPEELTGRASRTDEGVDTLFANRNSDHIADGFRGGSNNDEGSDLTTDADPTREKGEDVTAS